MCCLGWNRLRRATAGSPGRADAGARRIAAGGSRSSGLLAELDEAAEDAGDRGQLVQFFRGEVGASVGRRAPLARDLDDAQDLSFSDDRRAHDFVDQLATPPAEGNAFEDAGV